MDHQAALHRNLFERYALGILDPAEITEFEEHFFECPACGEEIRAVTLLLANMKAVLREQDAVRRCEIGHARKL